jgi:ammonium transporter, Amt family
VLNQAIGVLISIVLAVVGTLLILKVTDLVLGLRASKDEEYEGLDIAMHGEEGYNLDA